MINNVVHNITSPGTPITIFDSTLGDTTFNVLCRDSTFITNGVGTVTYSGTTSSIQLANIDWPNFTPAPPVVQSVSVPTIYNNVISAVGTFNTMGFAGWPVLAPGGSASYRITDVNYGVTIDSASTVTQVLVPIGLAFNGKEIVIINKSLVTVTLIPDGGGLVFPVGSQLILAGTVAGFYYTFFDNTWNRKF